MKALMTLVFLLMFTTSWAQQDTIVPPTKPVFNSELELELVTLLLIVQDVNEVDDDFMSVWLSIRVNQSCIMPYKVYYTEQDYKDIINGKMVLFQDLTVHLIKECRKQLGDD